MSDNKFILKLKGTQTPKSVVEIKNDKLVAPFVNVPHSSDAVGSIIQDTDSSVVVAKSAQNWKLNGNSLAPATNLTGDGGDYTGEYAVSGNGAWVNASYVFPNTGNPNNPTAAIFNAHTKWVLRLCGKNLLSDNGDTITFSFIVKIGSTNIMAKTITVRKSANFFCAQFVGDFSESAQTIIKAQQGQALTVQLLCADATASATIYNGMTVLTALQRRVDSDVVSSNTKTFDDLEEAVNDLVADIDTKVNIDGSSIMTGPLKFRAGSFEGAIAGGLGDGVSIYKLKADGSIDSEVASLTKTNGFVPGTNNSMDIGRNNVKWKDLYVARVIAGVLNNGANISVPTVGGTMALVEDINNKITNCITEIPQDINLELSSGTLTLKAGSKVYVPNGTGVFDTVTVSTDLSTTQTTDGVYLVAITSAGTSITTRLLANSASGAGATTTSGFAYDTTTNKINNYSSEGTIGAQYSFPVAIVTVSGGAISSIDQVFNGFGYIGSTVFALPGVKGLIPNGRNADGSLKNNTMTIQNVLTRTIPSNTGWHYLSISASGTSCDFRTNYFQGTSNPASAQQFSVFYNYDTNLSYLQATVDVWTQQNNFICPFRIEHESSSPYKIISMQPATVFHAVDYNDTEYIAHQAMPSDKYVDLTLGTSGATYTAPADGYLTVNKSASATGQYINFVNGSNGMNCNMIAPSALPLRLFIPVSKGDVVTINYDAAGTTTMFRFVYTNGSI